MSFRRIKFPLVIFFTSRMAIFLLAIIFVSLWPARTQPSFLEAFSRWDGEWYLRIVKDGYWYRGPKIQSPVAFFPLFPFFGKLLTYLGFSPETALFLVANLACLGFFIIFWLWAKKEFGQKIADWALFYYAISPLSFIFSSLYTESLFLLLSCGVFYLLKKSKFLSASLVAGLASATRPLGVVLVLPILWTGWKKKKKIWNLICMTLIAASGLVFFSTYLYFEFGKLTPFLEVVHGAWHRRWAMPWESLIIFVESVIFTRSDHPFFPIAVFDLIVILSFTWLMIYSFKRLEVSFQLYLWPAFLLTICQPWEPSFFLPSGSMARYMFQLFPLVALLAKLGQKNEFLHYLVIFFSASLFGVFSLAFFHWRWIE